MAFVQGYRDLTKRCRREGRRLLEPLTARQARVAEELQQQISLVRILEVLIWKSHPNRGGWRMKG